MRETNSNNLLESSKEEPFGFSKVEFKFLDELKIRLKDYMLHTNGIIESYVTQRKVFLEINLTLLILLATIISIIFQDAFQFISQFIRIGFIVIGFAYSIITVRGFI